MTLQFLFYFFIKLTLSEMVSTQNLKASHPASPLAVPALSTWIQLKFRCLVMRAGQFIIFYSFSFGSISQVTSDCGRLAFPSKVNERELKLAVVQIHTSGAELARATEQRWPWPVLKKTKKTQKTIVLKIGVPSRDSKPGPEEASSPETIDCFSLRIKKNYCCHQMTAEQSWSNTSPPGTQRTM